MWYQINSYPFCKAHVVYKIHYDGKYLVVAGKTIQRSIQNINTGLYYFFKGTPKGQQPDDLYHNFYQYVAANPFKEFEIELMMDTGSPFQMLKHEHQLLQFGKSDSACLNSKFEVYIPQFTQTNGKKSWINRGYYLNFKNWLRRQTK